MADLKQWVCKDGQHHSCGRMLLRSNAVTDRCLVYEKWLNTLIAERPIYEYPSLRHVLAERSSPSGTFARPRNLILCDHLIEVSQDSGRTPYVAVSYTWDPNPVFVYWEGRRVTTQALAIVKRFAQYTPYALWVDAICINQDDQEAKEEELPKMADIYRGAESVVCIMSGIDVRTCEAVKRGVQMIETEGYEDLRDAGDIYGCFLFVTAGANPAFQAMFQHRWWERAWTFQEATLNQRTFLVGDAGHLISIEDVLKITLVIRRRAATVAGLQKLIFGRSSAFWDSVSAMATAAMRPLSLGEAIACVWRRDASVQHDMVYSMIGVCGLARSVVPSYDKPFHLVLQELFEAAIGIGDYSWMTWSAEVHQAKCKDGMGLVPTPEVVKACPAISITSWSSVSISSSIPRFEGAGAGLLLPYRSTGVVRFHSPPISIFDTVAQLRHLKHTAEEIWDMLFGLRVGLMADISKSVSNDGIAESALRLALHLIKGEAPRDSTMSDMSGDRPYTKGISFTNYSLMAADSWSRSGVERLTVLSSQGGTVVIPIGEAVSSGGEAAIADRIYLLPVERSGRDESRGFAFITKTGSEGRFMVRATAIMVRTPGTGGGKWQLRRIG